MTASTPRATVSDWQITEDLLSREPTRWGSLSWTSARTLIDGVNQALNFGSDNLVEQLRNRWVAPGGPPLVEQPGVDTFMIIGDTGEQDASQYVVCPALSDAVREHSPGFVMIMSDVIYPAGHVDDYVDGVYRPYRGEAPHFRVDAPLLAIPGNHDWYDGLAGSCTTSAIGAGCRWTRTPRRRRRPDRCWPDRSASCGGGRPSRRRRPGCTMISRSSPGMP